MSREEVPGRFMSRLFFYMYIADGALKYLKSKKYLYPSTFRRRFSRWLRNCEEAFCATDRSDFACNNLPYVRTT